MSVCCALHIRAFRYSWCAIVVASVFFYVYLYVCSCFRYVRLHSNTNKVSYAMDAVLVGWLYGSTVRVSASYSTVIALIQYYTTSWVG